MWLSLSGVFLNFVRPWMQPFVLAAGAISVLLGMLPPCGLLSRSPRPEAHADAAHDHGGTGVAWFIVVPLLVVLVVPASPLGANAVGARRASLRTSSGSYPPIDTPVRGAVPMSMAEFQTRALRDADRSLDGVRVRLRGFVSEPSSNGSYSIARFVIFCCAADGEAVEVTVRGDDPGVRQNTWVEVEGEWEPGEAPTVRARSVRKIGKPREPYEYTVTWSG